MNQLIDLIFYTPKPHTMTLAVIIALITFLFVIYLLKGKQTTKTLANEPNSLLYWHLLSDLDHQNTIAPWEDILSSKLADTKETAQYVQGETYINQGEYDQLSDSYILKQYPINNLLFVYWRSPQKSWDHLAGREGYVVISKSEMKQIDFITTTLS